MLSLLLLISFNNTVSFLFSDQSTLLLFLTMEIEEQKAEQRQSSRKSLKRFIVSQFLLRTVEIAATLAAIGLMVTSKQIILIFGYPLIAKYSYSPAFKFFVGVNAVACVFYLLSLIFVLITASSPKPNYFTLFLPDFIGTVLVLPGSGAAFAIGYLGKYGSPHSYWYPVCDPFNKFCERTTAALAISCVGIILSVILTVWSAHRSTKVAVHNHFQGNY